MVYPSLEEYNEVFQNPKISLADNILKQGTVATTGLGMPLALCGGFALTYTITANSSKYAVRCFHKQSSELEKRYNSIAKKLKTLNSQYFLEFEFQPSGVKVKGNNYPLVKMAWAKGGTLGEYLDNNHNSMNHMKQIQNSLRELAKFLEANNIAHGDISPDNVMVSSDGKNIQLIDYDGMYVDDIKVLGSSELGNRNFQHIKRTSSIFDKTLDRFSFILLDTAIEALICNSNIWNTTQSDANAIIFRANDFTDPGASKVFNELFNTTQISQKAKNFANVCKSSFDKIPSLSDFISNINIPQAVISLNTSQNTISQYLSSYQVVNAKDYANCLKFVGDKVELIGCIVEVSKKTTKYGKPYIFINFGDWRNNNVKISIWSEGLKAITNEPNKTWEGKWISITGLMEPPYHSKYASSLSITLTTKNQLQQISKEEAMHRLAGSSVRVVSATRTNTLQNKDLLSDLKRTTTSPRNTIKPQANSINQATASTSQITQKMTPNQKILEDLAKKQQVQNSTIAQTRPTASRGQRFTPPNKPQQTSNSNCFIATSIYGKDAVETNTLRAWRDKNLICSTSGRLFVFTYYKISPLLLPIINRNPWIKQIVKKQLDNFVASITKSING